MTRLVSSVLRAVGLGKAAGASRFLVRNHTRMAGGVEQVVASAVSMVGLIILSRLMSIDDFGTLATASGIWMIMEMIQYSVAISPFVVLCPDPVQDPHEFGAWLGWNLVVSSAFAVLFLSVGYLLRPLLPQFAEGLILSVPMSLAGMLYMFARRLHYHRQDRKALLAQTGLYGLSYLGAVLIVVATVPVLTPAWGTFILAVAYGVPGLAFTALIARTARFDRHSCHRIIRSRAVILQFTTASVIWQVSNAATLIALSILSTPDAVAVFSNTRTLVRPITLIMSTLIDTDFSRGSRSYVAHGKAGLARVINSVWKASALLSVVPICLLLAFPGFFMALVYGQQYAHATLELQLRALLFIPLIYVAPLDLGLTVMCDTSFLIRAHLISLVAGLLCLFAFYQLGEFNASTALLSLIFSRLVSMPLLHVRYNRLIAEPDADMSTPTTTAEAKHGL